MLRASSSSHIHDIRHCTQGNRIKLFFATETQSAQSFVSFLGDCHINLEIVGAIL